MEKGLSKVAKQRLLALAIVSTIGISGCGESKVIAPTETSLQQDTKTSKSNIYEIGYKGGSLDLSKYKDSTDTKALVTALQTLPIDFKVSGGYRLSDLKTDEEINKVYVNSVQDEIFTEPFNGGFAEVYDLSFYDYSGRNHLYMDSTGNILTLLFDRDACIEDEITFGGYTVEDFEKDRTSAFSDLFDDGVTDNPEWWYIMGFVGDGKDQWLTSWEYPSAKENEWVQMQVEYTSKDMSQVDYVELNYSFPKISEDLVNSTGNARDTLESWIDQ